MRYRAELRQDVDEKLSVLVRHPVRLFVFDDGRGRGTLWGVVQTEDAHVVAVGDVNLRDQGRRIVSSPPLSFVYLFLSLCMDLVVHITRSSAICIDSCIPSYNSISFPDP